MIKPSLKITLPLITLALALTAACKKTEKAEPATATGSSAATQQGAGSAVAAGSGSDNATGVADAGSDKAGSASGSAAPESGSASAGSGDGSAGAVSGAIADACETYYQAEVKFAKEQKREPVDKHDAFIAACKKLPEELQTCQADWKYASAHDDACSKLLKTNVKQVQALRRMVSGM